MSSSDGRDGQEGPSSRFTVDGGGGSLETMVFECLVHQLIEKGVLTKNDALSIVQTVAQVKRGYLDEAMAAAEIRAEIALLSRLYGSFEALRERSDAASADHDNVRQLRPPLHGNAPEFPGDG